MSTMTLTIERTPRTLMINGQAVIVEELGLPYLTGFVIHCEIIEESLAA